jgi:hypothetical protein
VFRIEPIDIFLLNRDDQVTFFARVYSIFNLLKNKIQINVLVRKTDLKDFSEHFSSLIKQNAVNDTRLEFVKGVIQDLSSIIEDPEETILHKSFCFQLSEKCNVLNEKSVLEAVKKLDSHTQRITGAFIRAGIEVDQVLEEDLKHYLHQFYQ